MCWRHLMKATMNLADSVHLRISEAGHGSDCATETVNGHAERVPRPVRAHFIPGNAPSFEFDGYRIGIANTEAQLGEVLSLVHRMYSWRGYVTSVEKERRAMADRITLKASAGEHVMGTLSVVMDSADGLAADELYPNESNDLRKSGKRLCEFTRLAIDIGPHFNSKDVLARLIHVAFAYAYLVRHATDMLIEVNPRHVGFYRRSLGFSQIGPERVCSRVNAPAVLMHIDLHHMATQIRVHGGRNRHGGERTLYPHFLSGVEQRVLFTCIWRYLHHLKSAGTQSLPDTASLGYPVQRPPVAEAQRPQSQLERRVRSQQSARDLPVTDAAGVAQGLA
jgi:hypothetical protein